MLRLALASAVASLALLVPVGNSSTSHPPFCGHGSYIYYPGGNTDRLVYHHYLNSQGDHMHFYNHQRLVAWKWVTLHGFWRFC